MTCSFCGKCIAVNRLENIGYCCTCTQLSLLHTEYKGVSCISYMCYMRMSGCFVFSTSSWASAFCAHCMWLVGWVISVCALCTQTHIFYRQYLIFSIIMESGFLGRLLLSFSGSDPIMINISDVPPKSVYWHWFKVWPLLTYILLWMCFYH